MMDVIIGSYNYWVTILLMMIGFYAVITSYNFVKKLIGLAIFQVSVLLFYISAGYLKDGEVPILQEGVTAYTNPLPHVLMLTAIVVGVSVLAVGLAVIVRIKESYGSIEENEIIHMDEEHDTHD